NEPRRARVMLRQVLDDDARLRHGAIPRLVAQDRDLGDRPDLLECRRGGSVEEIDDDRLERRAVLIERRERLLAKRGKRMEVEFQCHTKTSLRFPMASGWKRPTCFLVDCAGHTSTSRIKRTHRRARRAMRILT